MKNWILWSFSRGSFQYDVLCAVILVAIFAIPPQVFNDRPEYMRLPTSGEVKNSFDSDGNMVYTVKVNVMSSDRSQSALREDALRNLQSYLGVEALPETYRVEQVADHRGTVEAFAFWIK